MFKKIFIAFVLLTILISSPIKAQSPTLEISTPTTASSSIVDKLRQIKILKEKIATKVAEIREKDKRAVLGIVKKIQSSDIIVTSGQTDRSISFSEDTLFFLLSKEGKSEASLKKIKEGDTISAYGYLSEDNKLLSAKYIYLQTPATHLTGKTADIDNKNYTITISTTQGNQIIDMETYTRTFIYTKDKVKKPAGFSKLKLGDIVHLVGTLDAKEPGKIHATKILIIAPLAQTTPTPTKVATISATLP